MKRAVMILICVMALLLLVGCQCTHDWVAADCHTAKTCVRCKEIVGEPIGHSWSEATCTSPSVCSFCGMTNGQAQGHSWSEATCTSPSVCSFCGTTNGQAQEHSWSEASCTLPSVCTRCGVSSGNTPEHSWIPAVTRNGIEGLICVECQEPLMPTSTWTPLTDCEKHLASNEDGHFADIVVGDWQTRAGKLPDSLRFCVANKDSYRNTHYIIYDLDEHYNYLSGLISFSEKSQAHAEAKILIYLDNELAYESGEISASSYDVSFTVDVEGVKYVRVVCTTTKEYSAYCVLSASLY